MSMALEQYIFTAPGDDFVPMEDQPGYIRITDKASIKPVSVMGKPADFIIAIKEELEKGKISLFDSITIKTNDGEAFAWWQEEIPPAGSGYPVFLSFSIALSKYQHITMMIVGVYPKQAHEDLKSRYIKSSFTAALTPKQ